MIVEEHPLNRAESYIEKPAIRIAKHIIHTIQKGETLAGIAIKYGVSVFCH